jgi:transcriptional regulator with XRE-family HTH domain
MEYEDVIVDTITKSGLSQSAVAKILGISQPAVSQKLHGLRAWTLRDLKLLNRALPTEPVENIVITMRAPRAAAVYRRERSDRLGPRRERVLALLAEGRTALEAGQVLLAEGFTCNSRDPAKTVYSDRDYWRRKGRVVDDPKVESKSAETADFDSDIPADLAAATNPRFRQPTSRNSAALFPAGSVARRAEQRELVFA